MNEKLKDTISEFLEGRVDDFGIASVERFDGAPEGHHPSVICKDARSVIVLGRVVPRGILYSPQYAQYFMHRTYHSVYPYLDELGLMLCNLIETEGALAVPVPSFAPLVYHDAVPWGILSLKHAAVAAGLGAFGRSGQMYHPQYGSMLRLGAVVTNAELPADTVNDEMPCPTKCRACIENCPAQAFDENGVFRKLKCLAYTIRHAIYPLTLKDKAGIEKIEMINNTAGYNYWIKCNVCLKVCPKSGAKPKG